MKYSISAYSIIKNQTCWLNGQRDWHLAEKSSFSTFAKQAYRHYQLKYPKFFKMDGLCKLAFLTAEQLLDGVALLDKYEAAKVGIILANAAASLDTDTAYQQSMAEIPSPSLFVYTLPNIMLGELSIRHKLRGENACFIMDTFEANSMADYVQLLLDSEIVEACIVGWVDKMGEDYESLLCLVEPSSTAEIYPFDSQHLTLLYGSTN